MRYTTAILTTIPIRNIKIFPQLMFFIFSMDLWWNEVMYSIFFISIS